MDPVNAPTKFEVRSFTRYVQATFDVRSFTRSWDNSGT